MSDETTCASCGAERPDGALFCEYCNAPLVDDIGEHAIPCWGCKKWNAWERTSCSKCDANLMVSCMTCRADSPHHLGRCITCGHPY